MKSYRAELTIAVGSAVAAIISTVFAITTWGAAERANEAAFISQLNETLINLESLGYYTKEQERGISLANKRYILVGTAEYLISKLKGNLRPGHESILGKAYMDSGDLEQAIIHMENAANHSDASDILAAVSYRTLAYIYLDPSHIQNNEKSRRFFQSSLQLTESRSDRIGKDVHCYTLNAYNKAYPSTSSSEQSSSTC